MTKGGHLPHSVWPFPLLLTTPKTMKLHTHTHTHTILKQVTFCMEFWGVRFTPFVQASPSFS